MITVMLAHVQTAKRSGKKNWKEGICASHVLGCLSHICLNRMPRWLTGSHIVHPLAVVMSILQFKFTLLEMSNLFGFESMLRLIYSSINTCFDSIQYMYTLTIMVGIFSSYNYIHLVIFRDLSRFGSVVSDFYNMFCCHSLTEIYTEFLDKLYLIHAWIILLL